MKIQNNKIYTNLDLGVYKNSGVQLDLFNDLCNAEAW